MAIQKVTRNFVDLVGQTFHRLTVIRYLGRYPNGQSKWLCLCECGTETECNTARLRAGKKMSCGCGMREHYKTLNVTHGMDGTPTYRVWEHIKQRCDNPRSKSFPDYGGRGITVCNRWQNSFEAFFADMGEKPDGMSIERKDNSLGYSPENCKWATSEEQNNNKRNIKRYTFNGREQTLAQWARERGINRRTLQSRVQRGVPIEKALFMS